VTPEPGTCTARWATGNAAHDAGDLCRAPATEEIGDSEMCRHHYDRAMEWFYKRSIDLPRRYQRQLEDERRQVAADARLAAEARSIVYYLRRTDGLIKIGTSTTHRARFSSLRREHGELSLLLAYAGGYKEEADAHGRFAAARVTGEWFRPELPLLLTILRLRNATAGRESRLPEQVPVAQIRALIKTTRAQQNAA
jgi:hypothetical protein